MLKRIFKFISKIVISALLIYAYNVVAAPLNAAIPINYYTVGIVTFLGVPSMFFMVMLIKFIF